MHRRVFATREPVLDEEIMQHGCIMIALLLRFEHVGVGSNLRSRRFDDGFADREVQRQNEPVPAK